MNNQANNFNLIRLFACIQVLVLHSLDFYNIWFNNIFYKIWWLFPGVIIFFSLSGFLITRSFETNNINSFIKKRFLRIYPGLAVNIFITILILYVFGLIAFNLDFIKYLACQLTLFQFFVPESIKKFGLGHPNGALWTISIEIQFYILFCVIGNALKWKEKTTNFKTLFIASLILLSSCINYYSNQYLEHESILYKLVFNSIFYNFSFFGIGMLIWINIDRLRNLFEEKFSFWIVGLTLGIIIITYHDVPIRRYQFEFISFLYLILLVSTLFSLAFSYKSLSFKLIGNTDISYGTYLYHCLIINLFLQLNLSSKYIWVIYLASFFLGYLSWLFVEKRYLKLRHTLIIKDVL
nr:acyltransferase [Pedobacter glucosidilyticus]